MPSCEMMMMTKATMEMQWTCEHGGVLRGREQTLLVHAMGLWNSDLVWRDEDGGMKGTRKDTIDSTEHVAVIMSVLSRDDRSQRIHRKLFVPRPLTAAVLWRTPSRSSHTARTHAQPWVAGPLLLQRSFAP